MNHGVKTLNLILLTETVDVGREEELIHHYDSLTYLGQQECLKKAGLRNIKP